MNSNLEENAGFKEVFLKKITYSVSCAVFSNVTVIYVYIILINFHFHPLDWLSSTFDTITSFTTWMYLLTFTFTIFVQIMICAKNYVLQPTCPLTRFQKFISFFSIRGFSLAVLHIIVGGVMVSLYLALAGGEYESLYVPCEEKKYCLVEGTFFLVVGGLWIGVYYFLYINFSDRSLVFPVIQQRKLQHFKSQFLLIVNKSREDALKPTAYYIILYYFFGYQLRSAFADFWNVNIQEQVSTFWIYKYTWLFSVLYILNMSLMKFFFELYLMEPIEHLILSENEDDGTLAKALLLNVPILQHLACLDLYLLSNWSLPRRRLLFTLSQPGGHPYTWNGLFQSISKILTDFTDDLNRTIDEILKEEQPAPTSNLIIRRIQSPVVTHTDYKNMRNMSMPAYIEPEDELFRDHLAQEQTNQVLLNLRKKIMEIRIISYVFGELPEARIQNCLRNGQLVIWISQGLANMAVSSFYEDPFGIIQKDLPLITTTLVNLKFSLERLNKLPIFTKRKSSSEFNYRMKNSLNAAVKRSLCNICKTYGKYLPDITLEKNIADHLQCYL